MLFLVNVYNCVVLYKNKIVCSVLFQISTSYNPGGFYLSTCVAPVDPRVFINWEWNNFSSFCSDQFNFENIR